MARKYPHPLYSGSRTRPAPAVRIDVGAFTRLAWLGTALLITALVLFGTAASVRAAEPLAMLFGPATGASADRKATMAAGADARVSRQRAVAVNFQYLDPRSTGAPAELGVELFDGQFVTLERGRVEQRGRDNYTWHGRVRGYEGSDVLLTVVDGQIAGTVVVADSGLRTVDTYEIQSLPGGGHALRRLNSGAFPPDHPPGHETTHGHARVLASTAGEARADTAADAIVSAADGGEAIDVMVVYSTQTAAAAGATIGAQIQQAIDRANLAYANSAIATRLRLVHYAAAGYSESGDFSTDLNRLTNTADGYMDAVHALRNSYGADLVSLFVENGQYCGIGWLGSSQSYGFTVVNRGCAGGNLSLAHEIGHNIGARHDPYVDPGNSPYAYGHGYTYPAAGWRTVMAYNDACAAAGTSCTRIPYFSNPNIGYGNPLQPTGTTGTHDNARLINANAYAIANFRQAATGSVCVYSLSPASASATAAGGAGSATVSAGAGCAWASASNAPWLTLAADSGASASGTLKYLVAANTGPARSGTIAVGDKTFTVNQSTGCTYTLNPASASAAAGGGSGSFGVVTGASCPWSVGSGASWLSVTSAASGTGSTTVAYLVQPNAGAARSGNLTAGGKTFIVTQAAPPIAKLSATSIAFSAQKVGTTSPGTSVTLRNSGAGTLTIGALTQTGANSGEFTRASTCAAGTTLTGTQTCMIAYTFRPGAKGTRVASLAVATSAGTATLALSGTGR